MDNEAAKMETTNQLVLERFCGSEVFAVDKVEVWVSHPRDEEEGGILLNLEVHGKEVITCTVPDDELPLHDPEPIAEVWLPVPTLRVRELVGTTVEVELSYFAARDAMNRLYYCEHEKLWAIKADFLQVEGDVCRVRFVGTATDINHYGGDKPDTLVKADVWFSIPEKYLVDD